MIIKSIAYAVAQCIECNSLIVYKPASEGIPMVCHKCGVRHDVELTQEQRMQMERMSNNHPGHHTSMNNNRSYTIRF